MFRYIVILFVIFSLGYWIGYCVRSQFENKCPILFVRYHVPIDSISEKEAAEYMTYRFNEYDSSTDKKSIAVTEVYVGYFECPSTQYTMMHVRIKSQDVYFLYNYEPLLEEDPDAEFFAVIGRKKYCFNQSYLSWFYHNKKFVKFSQIKENDD